MASRNLTRHLRALAVGALLLLAACSGSVSVGDPGAVEPKELAEQVTAALKKETGRSTIPTVTCPDPLKARVGATAICQAGTGSSKERVDVTATSVEDGQVKFDVEIKAKKSDVTDETPETTRSETDDTGSETPEITPDELASEVADSLAAKNGDLPPTITCDEPLEIRVDATAQCVLIGDEDSYDVTVTATAVNDARTHVDFDVDVAETPS